MKSYVYIVAQDGRVWECYDVPRGKEAEVSREFLNVVIDPRHDHFTIPVQSDFSPFQNKKDGFVPPRTISYATFRCVGRVRGPKKNSEPLSSGKLKDLRDEYDFSAVSAIKSLSNLYRQAAGLVSTEEEEEDLLMDTPDEPKSYDCSIK